MFQLSIITPSGKVFEDSIDSLYAPGLMGGFEVYSNHEPILYALTSGKIRIRKGGTEQSLAIDSGVLEVDGKHNVLLLADQILPEK